MRTTLLSPTHSRQEGSATPELCPSCLASTLPADLEARILRRLGRGWPSSGGRPCRNDLLGELLAKWLPPDRSLVCRKGILRVGESLDPFLSRMFADDVGPAPCTSNHEPEVSP